MPIPPAPPFFAVRPTSRMSLVTIVRRCDTARCHRSGSARVFRSSCTSRSCHREIVTSSSDCIRPIPDIIADGQLALPTPCSKLFAYRNRDSAVRMRHPRAVCLKTPNSMSQQYGQALLRVLRPSCSFNSAAPPPPIDHGCLWNCSRSESPRSRNRLAILADQSAPRSPTKPDPAMDRWE